jgi:hypothetical protein
MDGGIADKTDQSAPGAPRKKSEARQRQKQIKIRCTSAEFNEAAANAAKSGLSVSAYARAAMLGNSGPRSKARLPVDAALLREALNALGRYGNNWNQVAYKLNTGAAPMAMQDEVRAEIGNLHEIRDLLLAALRPGTSPA